MRHRLIIIVIFIQNSLFLSAQSDSVSLLFLGDIMGHSTQIKSASRDEGAHYDYTECFKYVRPFIRNSDLTIANLEVTLAGEPYTGYPAFSSPDQLAEAIQAAGIDVLVTANNHCVDRRSKGLERTAKTLDKLMIPRTGTFTDSMDRVQNNPIKVVINGFRLAILNYTYGTNGIPVSSPNLVNHLDRDLIMKDIREAQTFNPDEIIAFVHWGREYETSPNKDQTSLALFFHENGVNLVIGSHPHVIQPMHLTENNSGQRQLVVYSLGNFISNQRQPLTDGGAMVRVVLKREKDNVVIHKAEHILTWVHYPVFDGRRHYYVLPATGSSQVPADVPKGHEKMDDYMKKARQIMKSNTHVPEKTMSPLCKEEAHASKK